MKIKTHMTTVLMIGAVAISTPILAQSYGSGSKPAPAAKSTTYGSGAAKATENVQTGVHAAWDGLLKQYVSAPDSQGLTHFNYSGLKSATADKAALDGYIRSLEAINPDGLNEDEAIAYYANLYNAVTIKVVVENYPVKSIRDIKSGFVPGPWGKKLVTINGKPTSLNNIEHDILRKRYPSPYVHYMVNCASVGCPNLLDKAWTAANYKTEREVAAKAYINSPRGVKVTPKGLEVSSIYKWFSKDFGGKAGLLPHLRKYAGPELAQVIDNGAKVSGNGYNWALNE